MEILCVIPARGGSKRVPNKNIRNVLGKPLIAYTVESALESSLCTKVVVSTDDSEIARASKKIGADIIMRPDDIALDTSPIDDALRHAVRSLEKEEGVKYDIVVLLQANVPVRKKGEIDEVIKKLLKIKDATAVVTVYAIDQRPEWMKMIDLDTGGIKPFMELTNLYRKQDLPELYLLDGAIIAVRTDALIETEGIKRIHSYLGDRVYPFIHDAKYAVEIDEEKDLELAEYYLLKEQHDKNE